MKTITHQLSIDIDHEDRDSVILVSAVIALPVLFNELDRSRFAIQLVELINGEVQFFVELLLDEVMLTYISKERRLFEADWLETNSLETSDDRLIAISEH